MEVAYRYTTCGRYNSYPDDIRTATKKTDALRSQRPWSSIPSSAKAQVVDPDPYQLNSNNQHNDRARATERQTYNKEEHRQHDHHHHIHLAYLC
jgi:hypothetical protein